MRSSNVKETLSPQWTLKNVYDMESVPPQIFILSLVIWPKILTKLTFTDQVVVKVTEHVDKATKSLEKKPFFVLTQAK